MQLKVRHRNYLDVMTQILGDDLIFSRSTPNREALASGAISGFASKKVLPLASLTDFIDDWLKKHPECKIDDVHETTAIDRHCSPQHDTNIGFVLAPMNKSDLFKTVGILGFA